MSRHARQKDPFGIYHIFSRSLSEINLFPNAQDKNHFLETIKKYQVIYNFRVYTYCLMTNHYHFIIDCNGSDISKFMKSINQSYAQYFNKKYQRHGHLFQERFSSIAISDDTDRYLLTASAYIHNNPKDIKGYRDNVENYAFSSLGIYLGLRKDTYNILDPTFILEKFSHDSSRAKQLYMEFVNTYITRDIKEVYSKCPECKNNKIEDTVSSISLKKYKPEDIITFISNIFSISTGNINIKYVHQNVELKSLCTLLIHSLCGISYKDMSSIIENITPSELCRLSNKGYKIINENEKYKNIINEFIEYENC